MILVVVDKRYNETQFTTALRLLRQAGYKYTVASTKLVVSSETTGKRVRVHKLVTEVVSPYTFEGLVLISGHPEDTRSYWKDAHVREIVCAMAEKPVAAICASTATIRYIANGKRVASFPLGAVRELLVSAGALLSSRSVEVDGNLVTAENEGVVEIWIEEFIQVLRGEPRRYDLKDIGEMRRLKERMPVPEIEAMRINMGREPTKIRRQLNEEG